MILLTFDLALSVPWMLAYHMSTACKRQQKIWYRYIIAEIGNERYLLAYIMLG